jgi:aminopeptidase YwaD
VVITAHIDAKKGTPGAIDNATGVILLLLLAGRLADYTGPRQLEIVALNGEDYYAVPGQMDFIAHNQGGFAEMLVNINIDGAGHHEGPTALSFFNLPEEIQVQAGRVLERFPGLVEGPLWPQGDHSIFLQFGVPAIAVSSEMLVANMDSQDITHTPKDHPRIVDCGKLVAAAQALEVLIREL